MKSRNLASWIWGATAGILALILLMQVAWYITISDIKQKDALQQAQRVRYHVETGEYDAASRALYRPSRGLSELEEAPPVAPENVDNQEASPQERQPEASSLQEEGEPNVAQEQDAPQAAKPNQEKQAPRHESVTPKQEPQPVKMAQPRWQQYARKEFSNPEQKPTVTIVLVGLGLSKTHTNMAMQLPKSIGLSFSPYPKNIEEWTQQAHEAGYEVFLDVPMEPENYPLADAGPYALLTSHEEATLKENLQWMQTRTPYFLGMVSPIREKFTEFTQSTATALNILKSKEMLFVRAKPEISEPFRKAIQMTGMPAITSDMVIDQVISASEIHASLKNLVAIAKENTMAVGIAHPYPVTIKLLQKWEKEWEKQGVVLAPVSALVSM